MANEGVFEVKFVTTAEGDAAERTAQQITQIKTAAEGAKESTTKLGEAARETKSRTSDFGAETEKTELSLKSGLAATRGLAAALRGDLVNAARAAQTALQGLAGAARGPWGIAITVALSAAIAAFQNYKAKADEAGDAAEKAGTKAKSGIDGIAQSGEASETAFKDAVTSAGTLANALDAVINKARAARNAVTEIGEAKLAAALAAVDVEQAGGDLSEGEAMAKKAQLRADNEARNLASELAQTKAELLGKQAALQSGTAEENAARARADRSIRGAEEGIEAGAKLPGVEETIAWKEWAVKRAETYGNLTDEEVSALKAEIADLEEVRTALKIAHGKAAEMQATAQQLVATASALSQENENLKAQVAALEAKSTVLEFKQQAAGSQAAVAAGQAGKAIDTEKLQPMIEAAKKKGEQDRGAKEFVDAEAERLKREQEKKDADIQLKMKESRSPLSERFPEGYDPATGRRIGRDGRLRSRAGASDATPSSDLDDTRPGRIDTRPRRRRLPGGGGADSGADAGGAKIEQGSQKIDQAASGFQQSASNLGTTITTAMSGLIGVVQGQAKQISTLQSQMSAARSRGF